VASFIEPVPSREATEAVARQLECVREVFPHAQVRVIGPGERPEELANQWRVLVEIRCWPAASRSWIRAAG
jgi:hypothetical protein